MIVHIHHVCYSDLIMIITITIMITRIIITIIITIVRMITVIMIKTK